MSEPKTDLKTIHNIAHRLSFAEGGSGKVLIELLRTAGPEEISFRPGEKAWNIHEIACHLLDEEILDFRTRFFSVLENPDKEPPSIDPGGWVEKHNYAGKNYKDVVNAFALEREKSIAMLTAIQKPGLNNAWTHPKFGPLSARMFLNNWLAHDFLHIRQILKNKYFFLQSTSGVTLQYAGDW